MTGPDASAHGAASVEAAVPCLPQAGWIKPQSLVQSLLEACGARLRRHFGKELKALPSAPLVILANSSAAPGLHSVPHLRLRRVRGQLTHVPVDTIDAPHVVLLRGGMILPPVDGVCVVGACYDFDDEDAAPRAESDAGNLERLRKILGTPVQVSSLESRVAFRSVTPDRLPVAGKLGDGVYGAFAYGSRGLIWAALAAELIASELSGEPLPVEGKLADAINPARFARRAESRGSRPSRP